MPIMTCHIDNLLHIRVWDTITEADLSATLRAVDEALARGEQFCVLCEVGAVRRPSAALVWKGRTWLASRQQRIERLCQGAALSVPGFVLRQAARGALGTLNVNLRTAVVGHADEAIDWLRGAIARAA